MVSSERWLRWLCWALVVSVVISAVLTLGLSQNLFIAFNRPPDTADFVDRLLAFRAYDQQVYNLVLIGSMASLLVFVLAALIGAAVRPLARPGTARDAMVVLFVIGGVVGVVAELFNVAVAQAATYGYCDCGYRAEEVIGQDYALSVGWTIRTWLNLGAVTLVGLGAAMAGWLVALSALWRWLSCAIAIALLTAVVLRFLELGQISDLIVGITAGIAVPVWAILLARGAGRAGTAEG